MIQNGTYTLENTESGDHRTFRIRTILKGDLEGKRVVELLTGSDNTSDYTGFAFFNDDGRINVWRKKRETVYDQYARMLESHFAGRLPEKYNVLHEGRCLKCNRKLTTPESIKTGIGPVCAGKEG
jgi:hypothetical protein